jgi:predicted permease
MPDAGRPPRLFRFPWRSAERIADEIDDEVAFHFAMRERELQRDGLTAAQARAAARDKFGDVADMKRYCRALDARAERARRSRERMESIAQDLRYAVRQLRRSPAFSVTAVATLALGIGANVAIMSIVYRLLVAPLPFPDGERLVTVVRALGDGEMVVTPTPETLDALRERARSFEWVAAYSQKEVALGRSLETELLEGVSLEPELMARLAVPPALGRAFVAEEAVPNGPPVVMLGYALWRGRFGGARDVLGTTVPVDGVPHTIVGVTGRDFDVLSFGSWAGGQIWRPLAVAPDLLGITILGKLRPGVTLPRANEELAAIGAAIRAADEEHLILRAMPAKAETTDNTRRALLLLLGAVSVVLVIACANVANLLLVRAAARDREIAVRVALGAGRGRLVRQMLTESLLLALLGGAAGLFLAQSGLRALVAIRPDSLTDLATVRIDPLVFGWCLAISVACGALFGLAPAMVGAHRVDAALKGTRAASGTVASRRLRAVLVTAEVALSVALLVAAGLLVRSVRAMQAKDLGFEPAGLVSMRLTLPEGRYGSREARSAVFERILEGTGRIPGVGARTLASGVPPSTGVTFGALEVEGRATGDAPPGLIGFNMVRPDYFRMLGIAIDDGTIFGADTAGAVVINASMAAHLWPGERAVGRRFRIGDRGEFLSVVGVVADVRAPGRRTEAVELQMYRPFAGSWIQARFVIRPDRESSDLLGRVMQVVAEVDPSITVRDASTIESELAKGLAADRFNMRLLSGFAALALVLSTVGLYGVIAYGVAQRTRELGMRVALGAMRRDVLAMVVRQGLRLSLVGIVVGFAVAAAATRTMRSMLYEIEPLDPATYAGVGALILGISLVASWLPAWRAARIDPVAALRAE